MARVVNSIEELMKVLKQDVFEAMDNIKNEATHDNNNPKYVMMQKIDEKVYSGTNDWYENSFGLRDSVEATNAMDTGDVIEVGLYHDKNHPKFQPDPDNWQYGSFYSRLGTDIRDILPEILNNQRSWGVIEGLFNSDAAFRDKDRAYVDETANELRSGRLKLWMYKKLRSKGWRG